MATRTISDAGGNWNVASTWVEGIVPDLGGADDIRATATSGPLTINTNATVKSFDLTGYTSTLTQNSGFYIQTMNGNFILSSSMTYTPANLASCQLTFSATNNNGGVGYTIDTAGKTLPSVTFNDVGIGGKWVLSSNFICGNIITYSGGHLDTASFNIQATAWNSTTTNARILTLGSSSITITTGNWNWSSGTNTTINTNTATITINALSPSFTGGSANWNGLSLSMNPAGGPAANGGATYTTTNPGTLANLTTTGGTTHSFSGLTSLTGNMSITGSTTGSTLSVGSLSVGGNVTILGGNISNCIRVSSGSINAEGIIDIDNALFSGFTASGSAVWDVSNDYVGDAGSNTGIIFSASRTLYTLNTGTWTSATKWSLSNGGSADPMPAKAHDDVVILHSTTVPARACRNITATSGTLTTGSGSIYGSITIGSGSGMNSTSNIFTLLGSGTIDVAPTVNNPWTVASTGTYTLARSLVFGSTNSLIVSSGSFDSNGFALTTEDLTVSSGASFDASTSTITVRDDVTVSTALGSVDFSEASFVLSGTCTFNLPSGCTIGALISDSSVGSASVSISLSNSYTIGTLHLETVSGLGSRTLNITTDHTIGSLILLGSSSSAGISRMSTIASSNGSQRMLTITESANIDLASLYEITIAGALAPIYASNSVLRNCEQLISKGENLPQFDTGTQAPREEISFDLSASAKVRSGGVWVNKTPRNKHLGSFADVSGNKYWIPHTSDSFNRADGSLSGSSTDAALGGVSKSWNVLGGTPTISSNTAGYSSAETSAAVTGDLLTDQRVSVRYSVPNSSVSWNLYARSSTALSAQRPQNAYFVQIPTNSTPTLALGKLVSGSQTILASTNSEAYKTDDVISLECIGDKIRLLINGIRYLEVTDSSISSGYGGFGYWSTSTSARFDDFTIESLGTPSAPSVDVSNLEALNIDDGTVRLIWDRVLCTNYRIYRDGVLIGSTKKGFTTRFDDTTAVNNTEYTYTVKSVVGDYESTGSQVVITPTLEWTIATSDAFTRTGVLHGSSTDVAYGGSSATWAVGGSSSILTTASGGVRNTHTSTDGIASIPVPHTNIKCQLKPLVMPSTLSLGLISVLIRADSSGANGNSYMFRWSGSQGRIWKYIEGSITLIFEILPLMPLFTNKEILIYMTGSWIRVMCDGIEVAWVKDTTHTLGDYVSLGLRSGSGVGTSTNLVDDFIVWTSS